MGFSEAAKERPNPACAQTSCNSAVIMAEAPHSTPSCMGQPGTDALPPRTGTVWVGQVWPCAGNPLKPAHFLLRLVQLMGEPSTTAQGLHIKVTRWDNKGELDDVVIISCTISSMHSRRAVPPSLLRLQLLLGKPAAMRPSILGSAQKATKPIRSTTSSRPPLPFGPIGCVPAVWRTTRRAGELLRFPSGPDLGLEGLTQFGLERFEIGGVHPCKGSPWSVTLCHEGPCARCRSAFPSCECRG